MVINWSPTLDQELAQNVNFLLATEVGSVPLARDLGTPQDVVDEPQTAVAASLQAAVIKAVRTYEPRVNVRKLSFSGNADGVLEVVVPLEAP